MDKAEFLSYGKTVIEPVYIKEWDKTVYVKGMTALEHEIWESAARKKEKPATMPAYVGACLCDENGKLFFGEVANGLWTITDEEMTQLKSMPVAPMVTIFHAALKVCNVSTEEFQQLEKKS